MKPPLGHISSDRTDLVTSPKAESEKLSTAGEFLNFSQLFSENSVDKSELFGWLLEDIFCKLSKQK